MSNTLQTCHTIVIVLQFMLGAGLMFEGAQRFMSGDAPLLAIVLTLCGSISCALCVFHTSQHMKRDAVMAATVVASLWTMLAGFVFLRVLQANTEAATLLSNATLQLVGIVILSILPMKRNDWSAAEEEIAMNDRRRTGPPQHYGALSNFIDPPRTTTTTAIITPSPKPSPQLSATSPPRTPSPFGQPFSARSPQRSMASATETPQGETPDVVRGHYKAILEKYALDS